LNLHVFNLLSHIIHIMQKIHKKDTFYFFEHVPCSWLLIFCCCLR
jgi:hypothetical protein